MSEDIPEFLRIPQEIRNASWQRNPPKAVPGYGWEPTATEVLYRESIERDKAIKRELDRPRFEAMRAKAAADKAEQAALALATGAANRLHRTKFTSKKSTSRRKHK
jgi:hypothetical protein